LARLGPMLDDATASGYTDVWTSEVSSADAFAPLYVTAATHPKFRVGTAIASVFIRSPALLAMNAATLAAMSAAQTYVGIGASSEVVVRNWHGVPFRAPYSRVRDTLDFMNRALTGDRVKFSSDCFSIDGFRLGVVPERPPRILVAALRERMLRLAGTDADGVVLNWLSAADVAKVAPYVLDSNSDADIVARLSVVVAEDDEAARAFARRQVTAYLNVRIYADYHAWLGRSEILAPMWAAWRSGDRAAALAAVPDSLVDELFLIGSPADIRRGVDAYRDAGVTVPILSFVGPEPWIARSAMRQFGLSSEGT
jgi:probable F420-dependent oxidoreductase